MMDEDEDEDVDLDEPSAAPEPPVAAVPEVVADVVPELVAEGVPEAVPEVSSRPASGAVPEAPTIELDSAAVAGETSVELDEIEEVVEAPRIPPPPVLRPLPPPPPPTPSAIRPIMVVPPRPQVAVPALRVPPIGAKPVVARASQPIPVIAIPPPAITVPAARDAAPEEAPDAGRARRPSAPPSLPPPAPPITQPAHSPDDDSAPRRGGGELRLGEGGVEVGTATPNVVVDQPLEASLDTPTVIDLALAEVGDAGSEKRAETVAKELEATTDSAAAAYLAYELGELYERRLADEARAVKAYGRSLGLDPALRPKLWAIRRVL